MIDLEKLIQTIPDANLMASAPGRVNLLGEHVDYNNGVVLPIAIDRRVWLVVRPVDNRLIVLHALDLNQHITFSLDQLVNRVDIQGQSLPNWALYPAGVAWSLQNKGLSVSGIEAAYTSDVPIGAGLSSSAAVELSFAVLWQKLGGWELDRMTLARLCQAGENLYVGVNCGLMDQFASGHGVAQHALWFDTRSLEWQPIPLPPDTVVIVADSGVRRELAGSEYNNRRAACENAVELLNQRYQNIQSLRDVSPEVLEQNKDLFNEEIYKRARHVVDEIERVKKACEFLMKDDAAGFGKLMIAGHKSLRDLYEVSCVELDALVEIACDLEGCFGARLTGAGFGGCTVNLVKKDHKEVFIEKLKNGYLQRMNRRAEVYVCKASRGAYVKAIK